MSKSVKQYVSKLFVNNVCMGTTRETVPMMTFVLMKY